ncbi:hypothetical protein BDA96_02G148900 [Sorghum bicolor]|uniref:Uncharacterized protein n=1 Tax=Sorghum bicolor TaxID=4558 RepID=A0A921RNI2_SORBI|nr:hypothetical protein BDA96_02G148900 [Sorghum bicolor]
MEFYEVLLYRLEGADLVFYNGRRICNTSYLTNSKYDFFCLLTQFLFFNVTASVVRATSPLS